MLARIGMAVVLTLGFINVFAFGKTKANQSEDQGSTLRFKLRSSYQVIVPVSVNGLDPVGFILDTGTKTTIIDERICRKLDLSPKARMPFTSFTGTTMVNIVRLESLAMGAASANELEASCLVLRKVYSLDSDVYGVLGQNFLSHLGYLLDYREQRVVLDGNGTLERDLLGTQLPIETREYRDYVLDDPGSAARQPVRFLLDSGAGVPVIFQNPRKTPAFRSKEKVRGCLSLARWGIVVLRWVAFVSSESGA